MDLPTLRHIVQRVSAAQDLPHALQAMVDEVRAIVSTEAASIYLLDKQHAQYVLVAANGLNQNAIGHIHIGLDESLIGLVGRREEPINLDNAREHPEFLYHPEVGEDPYHAFLGMPIIYQRRLLGIFTLQQEAPRKFDEAEEAFVMTVCAQLASVIAHAEASGEISALLGASPIATRELDEAALSGIPGGLGVAIGTAVVVYPSADLDAVPHQTIDDVETELKTFKLALTAAREELLILQTKMRETLPKEEVELFEVYVKLLAPEGLGAEVCEVIREGLSAQSALRKIIKKHQLQFSQMDDEYLRDRAADITDLGRRILAQLQAKQTQLIDYPEQTILVGEEVSAAALAQVPEGRLAGIVSLKGSANAHVAILARALNVPTVMSAQGIALSKLSNKTVIVDGYFGQVFVNPSRDLFEEFQTLAMEERELDKSLEELRPLPAETPDRHRLSLFVNTGLTADTGLSLSVGAEGVGLFRTEVPFMARSSFPVEEVQRKLYFQLLKAFAPRPVTMRTLDIGGDKSLPYFPIDEPNAFLGWRGIRVTLDHPDVFLIQLRAMLRANADLGNLQIMFPMVSGIGELDEALKLLKQAHTEVCEEGYNIKKPAVGVMIEVPSAALQAKQLAKRVDFLSVGSNDLIQYLLAVDRNNVRVAGLYDGLHPAVLLALQQVVDGAHSEGKRVSICGEMAADPVAVVMLLAMGFDSLSMNAVSLPRVKWVIRNFSLAYARKLLNEALTMENPTLIRFHLERAIDEVGLGGLIRAGKR